MANEMIQKAKECKSAEELLALAKENGIEMTAEEAAEKFAQLHNEGELSDNELNGAAGGGCSDPIVCPRCGSTNTRRRGKEGDVFFYVCCDCRDMFGVKK